MQDGCYIIGSGIVGCVLARQIAEKGKEVYVLERRSHLGGNLYDYEDEYGVHVHLYGPHIFHTSDKGIYEYVSRFCRFEEYNLVCGAVIDGKCVPTAFDFSSVDMFFPEETEIIKNRIRELYGNAESASVLDLLNSSDPYIRKFAQFLYDKDYKLYTAKQWGIQPEEIDPQIFERVPIRFSYGAKYFTDEFQVMPSVGYMELIHNLLAMPNIHTQTDTDGLSLFSIENGRIQYQHKEFGGTLIYTGPIDELFLCCYGRLPYRSLRFEWVHEDVDSFQDMPVVAYPQAKEYTRITEYKKLPFQNVRGTTYAVEYPIPYKTGAKMEPYYPVLTKDSNVLYKKYAAEAARIANLYLCGRLAEFKYYNMDQAVKRALEMAEQIK